MAVEGRSRDGKKTLGARLAMWVAKPLQPPTLWVLVSDNEKYIRDVLS